MATKKNDEPYAEMIEITPKMAMDWLSAVPDYQRKIDERHVNKLVMAIQRKEWRLNGASIVFNERGDLIEGQHRLTAIARSGQTVPSFVVTGVAKDDLTFASLGDVKARKVTDFLYTKEVNNVAAVLRYIWFLENKLLSLAIRGSGIDNQNKLPKSPPVAEIVKLGKKHADAISEMVAPLSQARRLTRGGAWIVFLMYYFHHYRPQEEAVKVAEFFSRLSDGVGLDATSPILHLRNRCSERSGNFQLSLHVRQALILKALNYHLDGKKIDRLTFNSDREEFPPLRGYDLKEGKK